MRRLLSLSLFPVLLLVTACSESSTEPGEDHTGGRGSSAEDEDGGGTSGAGNLPEDGSTSVEIQFRALVGDRDFACGQTYEKIGAQETTVEAQDLRFYLQDVGLITKDGKEVPLELEERSPWQAEGVVLLDFEDGTEACERTGGSKDQNHRITGKLPEGDYEAITFTIGVPSELNHANPISLPAPLKASTMSWGWLMGFKFTKFELAEVDGTGVGFFHIGSTECDGDFIEETIECARPNRIRIRLEDFDWEQDRVVLDLARLFQSTDLSVSSQCHGGSAETCADMSAQLGLDWEKNSVDSSEQTVFRVEPRE